MRVEEIGAKLGFDHAGVHAFEDGDDAFEHHLFDHLLFAMAKFELARGGEEDEVCHGYAIDGGDEGDGDATADLVDVGEVLHDLDESEDGADDADSGRVASGGLEDGGNLFFDLGFVVELELHDLADLCGFGAVDGEHESLSEKRIRDGGEVSVEGDDAAPACLVGEGDDLSESCFAVRAFMEEDFNDGFEGGEEDVHRKLEHDSAEGATDDDHGRSGLGDLGDAAAFDHHAGENADEGESDATDAGDIHDFLFRVKLIIRAKLCGGGRVPTGRHRGQHVR